MSYQSEYFKKWYAANKQRLSEKRKALYKNDPAYKKAVKERSAAYRSGKEVSSVPAEYVAFNKAAEQLKVSNYVLRYWLENSYFPTPMRFGGKFYFTREQVLRLIPLRNFLAGRGKLKASERESLSGISDLIFMNWM